MAACQVTIVFYGCVLRSTKQKQALALANDLKQFSTQKVAILLCTYHGQHHLAEQLNSFAAQTFRNWELFASDDGSEDDTHSILNAYREKWGTQKLSVHFGPAEGFAANFLSLTCNARIQADYYAYSDQDDVWEPEKLERAVQWLKTIENGVPALYCTRTRLVDVSNQEIGLSPLFSRPPSFANALVQNIAGGNTMVFNSAARQLLQLAGENVDVVTHDWWAYMVIAGCGGKIFYDEHPSVRYRQHDGNLVGGNASWVARLQRVHMLITGRLRNWNERHIEALQRLRSQLTPENQSTLSTFAAARGTHFLPRLMGMRKSGVYRQTSMGNFGLFIAVLINKL